MLKNLITNRIFTYSILVIGIVILIFIPERLLFTDKYTVCMHKMILGIECSLCGMTRASYELLRLRFASALQYNFNVFLLVLYIVSDIVACAFPGKVINIVKKVSLILFISGLIILYVFRVGMHFGWFS